MRGEPQQGATVYTYKLDRLGRSIKPLRDLQQLSLKLVSPTDTINTDCLQKGFVPNLIASLAEFEREFIRAYDGLTAVRALCRAVSAGAAFSEKLSAPL